MRDALENHARGRVARICPLILEVARHSTTSRLQGPDLAVRGSRRIEPPWCVGQGVQTSRKPLGALRPASRRGRMPGRSRGTPKGIPLLFDLVRFWLCRSCRFPCRMVERLRQTFPFLSKPRIEPPQRHNATSPILCGFRRGGKSFVAASETPHPGDRSRCGVSCFGFFENAATLKAVSRAGCGVVADVAAFSRGIQEQGAKGDQSLEGVVSRYRANASLNCSSR